MIKKPALVKNINRKAAARDFDAFYQQRHQQAAADPDTGSVLVMSADGKGIVMRTADLGEQTSKAAEKRQHKMNKRLSRGEKKRQAHGHGFGCLHNPTVCPAAGGDCRREGIFRYTKAQPGA
ncbi:MAG: hypothetical protein ACLFNW_10760 [Desulfobacterales bacterium]